MVNHRPAVDHRVRDLGNKAGGSSPATRLGALVWARPIFAERKELIKDLVKLLHGFGGRVVRA